MPQTIDSVFGLQQMGKRAELFGDVSKHQLLRSKFEVEPCFGEIYTYDRLEFERSLAPITGRTAASREVKGADKDRVFMPLLAIRIHKKFKSATLFTSREPGEISDNAVAAVDRARKSLRNRIALTTERMAALAFTGTLAVNTTNFPDGTVEGASVSYDLTTLTAASASWATASTKIGSNDVQTWLDQIDAAAGMTIRELLFNRSVTKYLLANTEVQNWIQRTQRGISVFETSRLGQMAGIDAWTSYNGLFKPEGGSATKFIADKAVIALPEDAVAMAGLVMAEGFGEIPDNALGVNGSHPAGATKAPAPGIFEYALPLDGDPPGVKLVAGWYGIPVIKNPAAIGYIADVTA